MWTIVDKKRKKPASDLDFTKKEILKSLRSITKDDVEEYIKSCPLTMITNLEKGELKLKPLLLDCSNKFTHCVELFQKWYLTRKDDDYFIFDTHLDEFFSFFQTKKLGIFIEEEYKYLRVLPDTDLDIVYMKRRFLESGILGIYCSFEYNPTMDVHLLTVIRNSGEPYIIN